MADVKISGLPAATTPLTGTEVLPIVQSTTTKKVSVDNLTAGKAVSALSMTATNLKTSPATANLDISGTTIAAGGTDANVDVNINAKGSGVAYLNQRWGVNQSGALVASAGNTYDIGNGTNNPRDVNVDRNLIISAGTNTAPSITTTGDTNTGIFFPAADTIAFTKGGVEAMRIDSSGNVGINTSSPTSSKTDIYYGNNSTALRLSNPTGGTSGSPNYTELLFGVSNQLPSSGYSSFIRSYNSAAENYNSFLTFGTSNAESSPTERARITSDGEFYVAGTTDQGAYNIQCNGTGVWGAGAYVNGSDVRIKEDIAPIDSALHVVEKLNPVTYRYKENWSKDQSTQTGFIAQELLVALEDQNYVNGIVQQGGAEGYYSVAYQNIIPILTKAIQELKAELDVAKAEIAMLKK